jgi:Tfp pilus assembly protein PilF/4-amino-4-deoxy-L-arabinose transferase-like glycosyltransferase
VKRSALVIFALAVAVRGIYLWEISRSPLTSVLMGDAASYDRWARAIAAGDWLGREVFYQAPLYPYFLGALYWLFGAEPWVVRIVQLLLGAAACVLVAGATRQWFGDRAGVVAGLMLAVYPSAIFFDGLIQKSSLDLFLVGLWLFLLARAGNLPTRGRWFGCGATLGALVLTRENAVALAVVVAGWMVWRYRAALWRWLGAFVLGAAVVLGPVAARNRLVGGEFHLTTSQWGPNLYIGNHVGADGTYRPLRWGRANPDFEREDATELAELALGRKLTAREVSRYWAGRAWEFVRERPAEWLRLMWRKWWLVWNATELGDTEDQYGYAGESVLLRVLTAVFHFGVLCPLAVFGVCATWRERGRLWLLYGLLVAYAVSVAVFFVFARYRFPMVAMLVPFAAAGVTAAAGMRRGEFARCAAVALAAAVAVNWPLVPRGVIRAVTHYNLAGSLLQRPGMESEVKRHYREALRLRPEFVEARYNLASVLAAEGNSAEAIEQLREAVRVKPDFELAHYNLANLLSARGETREALQHYERAIELRPAFAEAHNNLGQLLAGLGRDEEAIAHYRQALRWRPDLAIAHYNLGNALMRQGELLGAVEQYQRALAIQPAFAEAHNNLGRVLQALGRSEQAEAHLREAARLKGR